MSKEENGKTDKHLDILTNITSIVQTDLEELKNLILSNSDTLGSKQMKNKIVYIFDNLSFYFKYYYYT